MISILIPVYNFNVCPLVQALQSQAQALGIDYELLCMDDASNTEYQQINHQLQALAGVRWINLKENIGRSRIRNRLAEEAKYEYLLYMDCDTLPQTKNYIALYVQALTPNSVLYGGRSYAPEAPKEESLHFHWHYGSQREVSSLAHRKAHPHRSFMTNNFLIPKALLLEIRFDESLSQYGHEDTLFGLELKRRKIPIIHLDNPMEHIGLEPIEVFLRKSEQAIENLYLLLQKEDFEGDIRLVNAYLKVKKWGMRPLVAGLFRVFRRFLLKKLHQKYPNLRYFDLYKLGYLCAMRR